MLGLNLKKTPSEAIITKCVDYIKSSDVYSFEKLLKDYGLFKDVKEQGENILIPCPFHEDYSPSMSINLNKKIYKCFSCDRGGGYFQFLLSYNKEVLGNNINFYTLLDNMLKSDQKMQLAVGKSTIYQEGIDIKENTFKRMRPNLVSLDETPKTYIELANRMKQDNKIAESDIILMLSLMQRGIKVSEIYKALYNIDNNTKDIDKLELDFSKLI